ncbi:hypothetical protein F5Y15DRAFT_412421 [Xylariaceae sp. FL0016]|nr:hypothetical protein F5Y15DRAFT_412421 [Xylariaceae sp. FL0016]
MDRLTTLRKQLYGNGPAGAFEKQPRERAQSMPMLRRTSVPEKSYVLDFPSRSTSVKTSKPLLTTKKAQSNLKSAFKAIKEEVFNDDEDYDSDEEDRRNGVPTTISEASTQKPQRKLVEEAQANIDRLKALRKELKKDYAQIGITYQRYRNRFALRRGMDWNAARWEKFLLVEGIYFDLQKRILMVEDEIQNLIAQSLCLRDHAQPSRRGRWYQEGQTLVWSLTGSQEEKRRYGDCKPPECNGVNLDGIY